MTFRATSLRIPAAIAAGALLIASCGGSTDSGAESTLAPTDTPVPTEVPVDTAAPAATEAPPATEAPAATDAPAATEAPVATDAPATTAASLDLTLRADGIGSLAFGSATPDEFVAALTPELGSPSTIESLDYPTDAGGYFENEPEERGFAFRSGRDVCFTNGLCAYFGGGSGDALTLVGYRQSEGSGALTTASGVTAGSQGADFSDVISVEPGGCFSQGGGTADGVQLYLNSVGEPFEFYDADADTYTTQAPAVADVSVVFVFAGEAPFYTYEDC